ncbi:MAG: RNA-binding transcriptional accessory protein [Gammaproteobacteria bacterium]|nr:RNA-binding transcriptional accessory protein [Gammaproteobacteria bacterium]
MNINQVIAHELNVKSEQVNAAIQLLDEGATVPFISRYRKEVTGGLDDTQLRFLEERLHYLRELEERRKTILKSIAEQNKLTPELEQTLLEVDNKAALEDLYLPYKPKRRTKAQIAREAGLEPLALQLLANPQLDPAIFSHQFIDADKQIASVEEALDGARYILMEIFSEEAELLGELREFVWEHAVLKSVVVKGKETVGVKYADYFTYQEAIKKIPSHRALALLRGQREEILSLTLNLDENDSDKCLQKLMSRFGVSNQGRAADAWLIESASLTWRVKFNVKFELELMSRVREKAEEEAIKVFANNLKHLLMAAPAGARVSLGLDPGLRTGVKFVVIDETGKLLFHEVIFPHAPRHAWDESLATLANVCRQFKVELICIGNGTASRETDKLITELKKRYPDLKLTSIVISEAGASVYSASEIAAEEFRELDVSYRGAVSIARRVQDPLAELVKIDPKAIGVGQYQHDVNQILLSRTLRAVMEDCVNAVGVDVNTASAPLLACIAGLNETIAKNIIHYRNEHGAFKDRQQLKKVARLGEKTFEQAAGFLRILQGDNPLDASAVHPEAYVVVQHMLDKQKKTIKEIMGNSTLLKKLNPADYTNEYFGLPTIVDILHELDKPGRDPRPEFKTAVFKEGVESIADLRVDMILEGIVTNVANFGAFVDIGVHQDGLVHVSALANHFVKDPHQFIKVGDIVKVKIVEIDIPRKRIQLSMRLTDAAAKVTPEKNKSSQQTSSNTLANAFLTAFKNQEKH